MRGQTTLPVLGVALLVVTAASVLVVVGSQSTIHRASDESLEAATAIALSERLVEPGTPLTTRANVLDAEALDSLEGSYLRENYGVPESVDVGIQLDGEELIDTGTGTDATSFERIILVEERLERRRTPPVQPGTAVTLPRRVDRVRLQLHPDPGTTVRSVTAAGQVVLHDADGLAGQYDLTLSRFETTALRIDATGPVDRGTLTLRYEVPRRHPARLTVEIDA